MPQEIQTSCIEEALSFTLLTATQHQLRVSQDDWHFPLLESSTTAKFTYRVVKRACDILIVLLLLPFALILLFALSIPLLLESPGPIFFSHTRVCGNRKYFSMWKFRTMCVDAQDALEAHFMDNPEAREEWSRNHKLQNDPRISCFGAFLRRTSLDELPQLWNVLVGDMSLIGPRPIVEEEIEKYGSDFKHYAAVKPGITGLWQVSGRSTLSYPERVALDRFYVENWSLRFELAILLRTIKSVALSEGAY